MFRSLSPEYGRFTALLPELARVVIRRDTSPDRMAAAGLRLGGLLAWGVEQARFAHELIKPELSEACWKASFPLIDVPAEADFAVLASEPQGSATITRYQVAGPSGEPLELLVAGPVAEQDIHTDGMLAYRLIRIVHRAPKRMSATDLGGLFRVTALLAATEASLAEEVRGLELALDSKWFQAPRIVHKGRTFLLETALDGDSLEQLRPAQREAAYHRVVTRWTRMLMHDGVLHVFLRRDQLRFDGADVGAGRWAGTCMPGPIIPAFLRSLVLGAFGAGTADQALNRDRASALLADGLGITGSLAELDELCHAVISQRTSLSLPRPLMPGLFVSEREGPEPPERLGLIRLLRQLVWFRDLGLACDVADLTRPWREVASEI